MGYNSLSIRYRLYDPEVDEVVVNKVVQFQVVLSLLGLKILRFRDPKDSWLPAPLCAQLRVKRELLEPGSQ